MPNDRPRYAINLKDERIVYRSKATDEMRALYRWIPNDVAQAIMDGKIEAKKVVNIITKKMFSDENFDHSEYEAELRKLNVVFKEEEVPEPEEVVDTTTDNPADSVTMNELTGGTAAHDAPAEAQADGEQAPPKRPANRHSRASNQSKDKPPKETPTEMPAEAQADGEQAAGGGDETLDI